MLKKRGQIESSLEKDQLYHIEAETTKYGLESPKLARQGIANDFYLLDTEECRSSFPEHNEEVQRLEWVLVSAAAISLYGHVLNDLLNQTIPLGEDVFYWDSVMSSPSNMLFYSLQSM